jgi:lipopolysaccharide/colanic/teichoic acid biosynthesis glycosyltransferase
MTSEAARPGEGRLVVDGRPRPRAAERVVKRTFDVVIGAACLLVLAPVLLAAAMAVRLSSPGPALFRQTRVGLGGREFVMLKFRTMRVGCSDEVHRSFVKALLRGQARTVDGLYKLAEDTRITRVGAVLRKLSVDELPQLINVLRGDMSLVGPRPALPWEVALFPEWSRARFEVSPGITGLWQVSGRNRLTLVQGLALDVAYVRRRNLWLDLRILARTVPAVVRGDAR